MDYKDTLNLPKTDFPMKAGLNEQEPARLARWEKDDLYNRILSRRNPDKKYILHDGPPYANGNIHLGTALNKILKDFVVKVKSGQGFYSPYVPGWDCHGLPIEHKVDKELGDKKLALTKNDIRKLCREYAAKWLDVQRQSFKRLGVIGDWDNPYITMDYVYESITLKEFYRVYKAGEVYKGAKPVYWCSSCVTALAEAEVEYASHTSFSIFVKFPLEEGSASKLGITEPVSAVIWTTTPWTLPANMAISANPAEEYSVMRVDKVQDDAQAGNLKEGELLLVAAPLTVEGEQEVPLREKLRIERWSLVKSISGDSLEHLQTKHPFYDRTSMIILGDHVLMTDGTGLVHTAPAHGLEDYAVGNKYGIEVYNPVDDYGKFREDLPLFGGMDINKANKKIIDLMQDNGTLIAWGKMEHSYPHCWRCKEPVIYRSTPQWFISMEVNGLREKALDAVYNKVKFIPSWGSNRIGSMVENRPDWCISRQRVWGVPIALFTCRKCEGVIFNEEMEKKVIDSFVKMGADAWFEHDVEYYLGKDAKCPHCGSGDIRQETDILDVWFDSGTSHAAVCEARPELGEADMYLEGSDQHRGWFQSSLLESIATRGKAPFKEILTHGFLVDADMKKMSKSVGNVVLPEEIIAKHGAEIMRLWVASEDYTDDIRISDEIIKRQVESYRKIRNTMRYLLGNLYDFNPDEDSVPFAEMMDLDRYILLKLDETLNKIYAGYEDYQFHAFYHAFMNFCTTDLSAVYLDILKDRLYSFNADSKKRRSAQTALFILARSMAVVMAPILSFTSDEVWEHLPHWSKKSLFVFEELFPETGVLKDDEVYARVEKLITLRKAVNKALETARAQKVIGHPLDAAVTIGTKFEVPDIDEGLARFLIVSEAVLKPFEQVDGVVNETGDISVKVVASSSEKCARCWTKDVSVGENADTPELCNRCISVLNGE